MSISDEGAAKIIANLNHQLTQTKGLTMSGLLAGGLIIQRNSQKRLPVEYGIMRASAYTRRDPEQPLTVEIGYHAAYAAAVHEDTEMKLAGRPRRSGVGVYWGPKGESQFLLKATRDETQNVLNTAGKYAQVKP